MKFDLKLFVQGDKALYVQIADAIVNSIVLGKLQVGDKIPSINQLSEEHFLSRDTVEKAYKELMKKGIIHSVKGKGYYIHRIDVQQKLRVLVIFNKLSNYKRQIYTAIIQTLGDDATVDLSIHHSNAQLLSTIIDNNIGMYDYYMIAPHFYVETECAFNAIMRLSPNKVILLDKEVPDSHIKYPGVFQDYERDIFQALNDGFFLLKKYRKIFLVFPAISRYPMEIIKGFKLFCIQNEFENDIKRGIEPFHVVNKGDAYIVIEEADLANLIKICNQQCLLVGKDIGIISYNDTPLKEILLDGITVMSTDHELMGKTAASLIINNRSAQVKNPFSLIVRKSL